ncbi:MAG TPA: zinc dependent phospholipase C family protein [Flavisolibacter sp.]|nr:zinc dependent phospholipase C family protein [Flavisolibacter sp.]
MKRFKRYLLITFLILPFYGNAYSVLTHEAIVDALWDATITPLLKKKYPHATPKELLDAKAYAYGGAVSPDMGYYPFGSALFTNLVHYVRSGDYVQALLDEQKSLNDYAFALGSLCHYTADTYGHPLGTNRTVPLVYPKVGKKFGKVVTYAEDKTSHLRMEFGFDVLQTARGSYATKQYHDFIGFALADTLMENAFLKTYGLDMKSLFTSFSLAANTFRWSVKDLFPGITKAAWNMKKKEIQKTQPKARSRDFIYKMKSRDFNKEFGEKRHKPGFFSSVLSFVIRILPKIGPLKALKFKTPGPEAEKLFILSFDSVVYHYRQNVKNQDPADIHLVNRDFDTGKKTMVGEYPLCDKAYLELLMKLKDHDFQNMTPSLRQNILQFYQDDSVINKMEPGKRDELLNALKALKNLTAYR